MNELTRVRSHIHGSIVIRVLAAHQIASDMKELTRKSTEPHARQHCYKGFSMQVITFLGTSTNSHIREAVYMQGL